MKTPVEELCLKIQMARRSGYNDIKVSITFLESLLQYFLQKVDTKLVDKPQSDEHIIIKTGGKFTK